MATSTEPHFTSIRLEHEAPLSWIVLNRPEKANALSGELLEEFSAALDWLASNGEPVIAIRGAGKGFSAGYDLGQVAANKVFDPVADHSRQVRNMNRYIAMAEHPKPIIAAVHGYCIAGGSQLASLADITIVTEDATIGLVTLPIGAGYVSPVWATLVGPKRAKELTFVPGNSIDGRTAVEWGWANHAVPADQLLDRVRSLAERIALMPPALLTLKKTSINNSMNAMGHRQAMTTSANLNALAHLTPDVQGVRARIADEGLRAVMDYYRVPPTTDLSD